MFGWFRSNGWKEEPVSKQQAIKGKAEADLGEKPEADCSQSSIFSYYPTALRMAKFDKNLSAGSMSVEWP